MKVSLSKERLSTEEVDYLKLMAAADARLCAQFTLEGIPTLAKHFAIQWHLIKSRVDAHYERVYPGTTERELT